MTLQISVVGDDITLVPADLLLLKHAQHFFGADQTVAHRLTGHGVCLAADLALGVGQHAFFETGGAIAAAAVLYIGVPGLAEFRYRDMRLFARRAIEIIAGYRQPVRTLATTVHGAGYGLDIEEALQSLVLGFQQGLATHPLPSLRQLFFVEHNARRLALLQGLLDDLDLVVPAHGMPAVAPPAALRAEPEAGRKKKCVFVAMPFSEEFEDIYQFGIYNTVRRCGYVCEKVDESVFSGSIVERITEGIRNADFVIADLTAERPNVYLEVGFAWGQQRPVILVAREGQKLHFDLSHHKCLFYRTIGKLAEALEKTILEMFGRGTHRDEPADR